MILKYGSTQKPNTKQKKIRNQIIYNMYTHSQQKTIHSNVYPLSIMYTVYISFTWYGYQTSCLS